MQNLNNNELNEYKKHMEEQYGINEKSINSFISSINNHLNTTIKDVVDERQLDGSLTPLFSKTIKKYALKANALNNKYNLLFNPYKVEDLYNSLYDIAEIAIKNYFDQKKLKNVQQFNSINGDSKKNEKLKEKYKNKIEQSALRTNINFIAKDKKEKENIIDGIYQVLGRTSQIDGMPYDFSKNYKNVLNYYDRNRALNLLQDKTIVKDEENMITFYKDENNNIYRLDGLYNSFDEFLKKDNLVDSMLSEYNRIAPQLENPIQDRYNDSFVKTKNVYHNDDVLFTYFQVKGFEPIIYRLPGYVAITKDNVKELQAKAMVFKPLTHIESERITALKTTNVTSKELDRLIEASKFNIENTIKGYKKYKQGNLDDIAKENFLIGLKDSYNALEAAVNAKLQKTSSIRFIKRTMIKNELKSMRHQIKKTFKISSEEFLRIMNPRNLANIHLKGDAFFDVERNIGVTKFNLLENEEVVNKEDYEKHIDEIINKPLNKKQPKQVDINEIKKEFNDNELNENNLKNKSFDDAKTVDDAKTIDDKLDEAFFKENNFEDLPDFNADELNVDNQEIGDGLKNIEVDEINKVDEEFEENELKGEVDGFNEEKEEEIKLHFDESNLENNAIKEPEKEDLKKVDNDKYYKEESIDSLEGYYEERPMAELDPNASSYYDEDEVSQSHMSNDSNLEDMSKQEELKVESNSSSKKIEINELKNQTKINNSNSIDDDFDLEINNNIEKGK